MPTSLDPPPADDELECGRCGAHFYYGLTRCPNCGTNIYEPEEESASGGWSRASDRASKSLGQRLDEWLRRLTKKPYAVDELFGAALNQAELFDDLLRKVGGDRQQAERLVEYERGKFPQGTRIAWLQNAIRRWERDNRAPRSGGV